LVLAGGPLQLLVRPGVRVGQRRGALHGLLVHPQDERARGLIGYGFCRDEMVLLREAHEPAHADVQEPQVAVLVDVEVRHLADAARAAFEDGLLAEFLVRGTRMLVVLQTVQVHGTPPSLPR
jgi:hypothetical protein